jgi:DNA repair protein RadC
MTIKSWPTRERPREKLLDAGAGALGDGELLAAILGTGTRGENAHELAMRLLAEFGGLHGLDEAGMHDILSVRGMGPPERRL